MRAALLEAAHSLFLRYGYRSVSARQVAGRAGVAPAMVQYYFGSKHGLCAAMLEEAIGPLVQKIEQVLAGPAREQVDLAGFLAAYMKVIAAHPWIPGLLIRDVLSPDGQFRDRFVRDFAGRMAPRLLQLIERAASQGQLRADLEPRLALVSLLSLGLWPFLTMPVLERALNFKADEAWIQELVEHTARLYAAGTARGELP